MRVVATIDKSWVKDILKWQEDPDVDKFILGEEGLEKVLQRVIDGELIWLGLEDGSWRGFATLEPHDDQAELSMYAPGRARQGIRAVCAILEKFPIVKIYMKVRADRLRQWRSYNMADWERICRFWDLKFVGLVGDPIGDSPYHILAAREINHGQGSGSISGSREPDQSANEHR